ncbi:uncharacterized protein LOC117174609 isoform X2 [Belonocnema kinseyi]|uniref:uncharacterized protein LOC117174609 isoform X2 n=1 Tax=Belonocnema kinseyi TaxID=2817044 RepID=UPI00143D88EF|nr:uncharacterized protein LOC117174609 isoform X2 [Belonocnema kinseyi]
MSDTEEIYNFQLGEFIKSGLKTGIRDIDLVTSKWITFNHTKGKPKTKFLPPPYKKKSKELLHFLIAAKVPPLQSWFSYTIMLKGNAKNRPSMKPMQ